ncbi:MAG TPA: penicillin-binding transpeptidase domain-containing protein [Candidatus Cryosericum sp.]|nr:penicillin-binding transpeptidase domain-containing protein [Candidatus Cryosericum sp.]
MAKVTAPAPKIKRKLVLLMVFAGILMLLLALRLTQVMIVQGPDLQTKAKSQWTRKENLAAQRGRIIDRNGLVLAQSGTAYRVLANPEEIAADDRVRIATEVSDILGLDYDYVLQRITPSTDTTAKKRLQVQLKRQVESSVVDQLEALQLGNGITFTTDMKRYYPFGQLFTQLVGFTGIDTEGQTGVEAEYDSYLAGEPGVLVSEVDRKNQPLSYGKEEYVPPTEGYDLTITADSVTQSYLEKYLQQCLVATKAKSVSGIVMDPNTGEILAISSYPSFDLNDPPRDMVTELMSMSKNQIVTETYEAGTSFDLITVAAALDSGNTSLDQTYKCSGSRIYRLQKITCWDTKGHGTQTLAEALGNSCNVAMMDIADAMGVNTFYDYIYGFGFGESTECGIPSEDTGEVIHRKYIRASDLAKLSFGETITMTPIEMASAFCAAINGGVLMKPYVIDSIKDADGTVILQNEPTILRRVISSSTSATLRSLMHSNVQKGNASNAQVINYTVGGITGVSRKFEEDGVTPSRMRVVASFTGFLPIDNPQLVCMIVVDEPAVPVMEASGIAAPWVNAVLTDLVQYYGILPDETTNTTTVPDLANLTGEQAIYELAKAGFTTNLVDSEKTAVVVSQYPAAGTQAASGSLVLIFTSMTTFNDEGVYKELVAVPSLIERRRQDAFDKLAALGLVLSFDKTQCTGQILTQSIPEGELVPPGTTVYVTFPTPTPVPAETEATPPPEN